MKALKITLLGILILITGLMTFAQLNYENCIQEASTKETDGEILQVIHEYGFRTGLYDEVTPQEKIKALFR